MIFSTGFLKIQLIRIGHFVPGNFINWVFWTLGILWRFVYGIYNRCLAVKRVLTIRESWK